MEEQSGFLPWALIDGNKKSVSFACNVCLSHARRWPARTGCSGTYPSDASVFVSPSSPLAQRFEIRILPSCQSTSLQRSARISEERSAVAAQGNAFVQKLGGGLEKHIVDTESDDNAAGNQAFVRREGANIE